MTLKQVQKLMKAVDEARQAREVLKADEDNELRIAVRAYLDRFDFPVAEKARRLGYTQVHLREVLNGSRNVSRSFVERLEGMEK